MKYGQQQNIMADRFDGCNQSRFDYVDASAKVHSHAFFQKKRFASLAAVCRWISLDARGGDKGCESKTKQGVDLKAAVFRM
jgi:hypothetical protein